MTILLLPLITTFLYYLGSAANITLPVRALLPQKLTDFLACPACSGFWYGLALGIYVHVRQLTELPPELAILGIAAASGVWTPLLAAVFLRSLADTSAIYADMGESEAEPEEDAVQDS